MQCAYTKITHFATYLDQNFKSDLALIIVLLLWNSNNDPGSQFRFPLFPAILSSELTKWSKKVKVRTQETIYSYIYRKEYA